MLSLWPAANSVQASIIGEIYPYLGPKYKMLRSDCEVLLVMHTGITIDLLSTGASQALDTFVYLY